MKNKHCEWCDHPFESKVSYQIYCSSECRESATKEKIAKRYLVTRIAKRAKKIRKCKTCEALLSIYNDDNFCTKCLADAEVAKALKDLKGIVNGKNKLND